MSVVQRDRRGMNHVRYLAGNRVPWRKDAMKLGESSDRRGMNHVRYLAGKIVPRRKGALKIGRAVGK